MLCDSLVVQGHIPVMLNVSIGSVPDHSVDCSEVI